MDVLNPNYSISAKLKENLSVSSFITSLDLLVIDTLVLSLKTTLKKDPSIQFLGLHIQTKDNT